MKSRSKANVAAALAAARRARGLTQDGLARTAGVSRAEVSAIETGRLVPSVAVALALAKSLDESVESLFGARGPAPSAGPEWVTEPRHGDRRYWDATVGARLLRYPAEALPVGTIAHDDVGAPRETSRDTVAARTLVVAGCDPAVGLLAEALRREGSTRLLPLHRSSGQALDLLRRGLVHAAGIHLCAASGTPVEDDVVRAELGGGSFEVVHVADWEEGVALGGRARSSALRTVLASRLRWIHREPGSGARQCLDALFAERSLRPPRERERVASGHRAVAEVIRSGCADAGVTVRLAAEEAGLAFLAVRRAPYQLWFRAELAEDARLLHLLAAVRSRPYRSAVAELPGYDSARTGELRRVA